MSEAWEGAAERCCLACPPPTWRGPSTRQPCSPDSLTHHSQQRAWGACCCVVTHAHCARVEAPQSNMALSSGPAFLQSGRQSSQTLMGVIENQLPRVIWWSLLGRLICRSYLIGSIVLRKNSSKIYPFKMVMLYGYRGHLLLFLTKHPPKRGPALQLLESMTYIKHDNKAFTSWNWIFIYLNSQIPAKPKCSLPLV